MLYTIGKTAIITKNLRHILREKRDMEPPTPGASGQGNNASANACLACRKIKMKCHLSPDSARCERCTRKSLDCVFQTHRRGRKLGTRLSVLHSGSRARPTNEAQAARAADPEELDQSMADAIVEESGTERETPMQSRGFWTDSEGFQPPSLLNKQAKGNFSLQNVLSTSTSGETPTASAIDPGDPIHRGLINDAIARSLFEGFMSNLNPFICQFDRILHSYNAVRDKSSFLFSSLLAAAAKALNPSLYPQLKDHAETLFSRALRLGVKSPEVVQAILVLTYWKEPDDTRAFVNVGLAIRIALELGWHKMDACGQPSTSQNYEGRSQRNVQRTWLVLFVYDRSISMQTGTPWMIQRSHFIESANDWLSSPLANENDALLCAFVSLRLLTSDIPELLSPQHGDHRDHTHRTRPLVKTMKDQIDRWQRKWTKVAVKERCHPFLTEFYSTHTLLLLFSLPLQSSLSDMRSLTDKHSLINIETLWISYSAALKMMQLVANDTNHSCLYFAQDSVHVMVAYAAVFLIKLLLSVPKSLRSEIQEPLLDSLSTASRVFSQQAAPPNSSSALQAVFLAKVVNMAEKTSRRPSLHHNLDPPSHSHLNEQRPSLEVDGVVAQGTSGMTTVNVQSQSVQESRRNFEAVEQNDESSVTPQSQELNFFDEEMWSTMFANAGFNINEGIFLPEASG